VTRPRFACAQLSAHVSLLKLATARQIDHDHRSTTLPLFSSRKSFNGRGSELSLRSRGNDKVFGADTAVAYTGSEKDWTVVVNLYAQPDEAEGRTADGKARLTLAIVEALKNKGLSQSDIARGYGVTRQYVSWIKHTYGGRLSPRETVLQEFPFKVSRAQGQTSPYRRLRDHAEFVATDGAGMSDSKLKRLRTFTGSFGKGPWSWSSIRTSRPSAG
jgi:hypothetical protein